jgi:monoamine oxidase
MSHSRRDFIKFVVAGSVTAGCPVEHSLIAEPDSSAGGRPAAVHGEHFDVCHALRDGHQFDRPDATRNADVVIIGAGSAGLSAAYFLRDLDFLLLEKEDHFGGNAYQEEFDGQPYATGSAYAYEGDHGDQLMRELGVKLLPVNDADPTIVNHTWVPDTWRSGIAQLPYKKEVRDSFRKFSEDMRKIDLRAHVLELDAEPFSKYTAPYAGEIAQWWDAAGLSNWGAATEDTSAMLGIGNVQAVISDEPDGRVILPGGLGCVTRKIVEVLAPKHKDRMLGDATVVAVVEEKDAVRVTYSHNGKLFTVAAKAVLMCAPKFIASRLVIGLPFEQKQAMRRTRYAPYPLVNIIFDKPVYNRGYDTWCPGNAFTDFIVADWTVRNEPGYKQKYNILSFYTPLRPEQRSTLLDENDCKTLAARVLADFQKLLPEFNVDPIEVRIYRRGHPMFMPTPGRYTRTRLAAAQPMDRIFFGHSDSGGPESLTSEAIRISKAGVEWAHMVLSGKPGAREFAQKALTVSRFD